MSEADALLRRGLQAHQSGRLDDAELLYRRILQSDPQNPNALNLLGMVHHQQGRHTQAEEFLRAAAALAPSIPGFHNNLGNVLLAQRRLDVAQECYERAIQLQPDYAEAHNNLGVALLGQGKVDEAMAQLVKTINLKSDYPSARNNLGNALRAKSMYPEAIACYRDALAQKRDYVEAHANLAIALLAMGQEQNAIAECEAALALRPDESGAILTRGLAMEKLGRTAEAVDSYRTALRLRPDSRGLRFQIAALTGEEAFAAVPPEIVTSLFDNYAQTFDLHLVERLKYRGPQLVCDALQSAGLKPGGDLPIGDIVDLGCGTGLCGPLLRPVARRLVGVDLSSRMIGQARERKVYDELLVDELTAFLSVRYSQFNAAAAADVLIYLGDLQPVLTAAAQALKPGGLFAFTVEAHGAEEGDGDGAPGYVLNPTRRYSHSMAYIRSLLPAAGLTEVSARRDVLRVEKSEDVSGWVIVLRKPV